MLKRERERERGKRANGCFYGPVSITCKIERRMESRRKRMALDSDA